MRRMRGKILKMKFGVNPNSSSIGSDIIFLMIGTASFFMLTFGISGFIRMFKRRKGHVEE